MKLEDFQTVIEDYLIPRNRFGFGGLDAPYAEIEAHVIHTDSSICIFPVQGGVIVLKDDGTWGYDEAAFPD